MAPVVYGLEQQRIHVDRIVTRMEPFRSGNNSNSQEEAFPSCLYSNGWSSMKDIIAGSREASTPSELTIAEDIIAIVSAIPSSIITYMSVHCDSVPSSIRTATYVLAIAIGSIIALHFEALRLLAKSRKI
jgi:hypothetical protein